MILLTDYMCQTLGSVGFFFFFLFKLYTNSAR